MNKQEFLAALREGLRGLPPADIEERIAFYDEMIDVLFQITFFHLLGYIVQVSEGL